MGSPTDKKRDKSTLASMLLQPGYLFSMDTAMVVQHIHSGTAQFAIIAEVCLIPHSFTKL